MMARRQAYTVRYAEVIKQQLRAIEKKHHSLIRETIAEQLTFEPGTETRNRKPLREPVMGGDWELRFGPQNFFRVYSSIDEENREVIVEAVGTKEGNKRIIEGEEES